jgi:hypothetical protein
MLRHRACTCEQLATRRVARHGFPGQVQYDQSFVPDLEPPADTENLLPELQPRPRRRAMVFVRVGVVVVTIGIVIAGAVTSYAYVFGDAGSQSGVDGRFASALARAVTSTTAAPTTTIPKPTTTTLPKPKQPPLLALPPVPGGSIGQGTRSPEVQMYELRLKQLHFDPGPVDGY